MKWKKLLLLLNLQKVSALYSRLEKEFHLFVIFFPPEDAFLRDWTDWSPCSISCKDEMSEQYGISTREAECVEGSNGGLTCNDRLGSTRNKKKIETKKCAGDLLQYVFCPINHKISKWGEWSNCPECTTNFRSVRKRKRICTPGKHHGSQCPQRFQ